MGLSVTGEVGQMSVVVAKKPVSRAETQNIRRLRANHDFIILESKARVVFLLTANRERQRDWMLHLHRKLLSGNDLEVEVGMRRLEIIRSDFRQRGNRFP
jgi:hypothetical protein